MPPSAEMTTSTTVGNRKPLDSVTPRIMSLFAEAAQIINRAPSACILDFLTYDSTEYVPRSKKRERLYINRPLDSPRHHKDWDNGQVHT